MQNDITPCKSGRIKRRGIYRSSRFTLPLDASKRQECVFSTFRGPKENLTDSGCLKIARLCNRDTSALSPMNFMQGLTTSWCAQSLGFPNRREITPSFFAGITFKHSDMINSIGRIDKRGTQKSSTVSVMGVRKSFKILGMGAAR